MDAEKDFGAYVLRASPRVAEPEGYREYLPIKHAYDKEFNFALLEWFEVYGTSPSSVGDLCIVLYFLLWIAEWPTTELKLALLTLRLRWDTVHNTPQGT